MLVVAGIAALLLGCVLLLQVPSVQTAIVGKVLSTLQEQTDGTISVGSVNFLPFNTLIIKDATVTDNRPDGDALHGMQDTLLHVRSIAATFDRRGISGKPFHIKRVTVDGATCTLVAAGDSNNFIRVFRSKRQGIIPDIGDVIHIDRVTGRDLHFRMFRTDVPADTVLYGFNPADMDLTAEIVKGRDVRFRDGHILFEVEDARIHSGQDYSLGSISGKADVTTYTREITDLRISDPWSRIDMPLLRMTSADEAGQTGDFTLDNIFDVTLSRSTLDARTVNYFSRDRDALGFCFDIDGASLHGTVDDLSMERLSIKDISGVSATLGARARHITTPEQASVDITVQTLSFDTSAMQELIRSFGGSADISNLAPGQAVSVQARARGPLDRLDIQAGAQAGELGRIACNLAVAGLTKSGAVSVSGSVDSDDLDIGGIMGNETLRQCTLHGVLDADIDGERSTVRIDTLFVDRLHLMGYDYSPLAAAGTFSGSAFDGRIICGDPNLNFLFQGIFNLSGKTSNALYKFYLNLGYADLAALGFDKRSTSRASASVNANYMRISTGEILGDVDVRRLMLESPSGMHDIGDISISSNYSGDTHRILLESDFLKGTFVSDHNPLEAASILRDATVREALPSLCSEEESSVSGSLDVELMFADSHKLLSFLMPGSYIADGTSVKMGVSEQGTMTLSASAQRIAIKDKYIKDLSVEGRASGGRMRLAASSGEIAAGGPLRLMAGRLDASASGDHIDAGFSFDNDSTAHGSLLADADLIRTADERITVEAHTLPSDITIVSRDWKILPSTITLDSGDIKVDGVSLRCGDQSISARGGLSKEHSDTLLVSLGRVDLEMFSALAGMDFGGALSGQAVIASPYSRGTNLSAYLTSDSTRLSGYDAGTLYAGVDWDEERSSLDFRLHNELNGRSNLAASGYFLPSASALDARIDLDSLNLGYLSGLSAGIADIRGSVSGSVTASGPVDSLSLSGTGTRLQDMQVAMDFTGVTYHIDGPVGISESGISLDSLSLTDGAKGRARLSGGIGYDRLKDIRAGIRAEFEDLLVFDIPADTPDADIFGHLAASGRLAAEGPFDDLAINLQARNSGTSDLHVPVRSGTVSSTNLLTFKQEEVWEDPYEKMLREMNAKIQKAGNLDILMHLSPTSGLEVALDLDRATGNSVSARGSGDLDVRFNPGRDILNVSGDYTISSGNVHFSALGITSRDFGIKDGSSLKFNGGDIMESELDINASYTTKVSLANLIADTTSVSTRRTVECGINISDKMRNPQLKFSIDIPDLDPTVASSVQSALNTEDKVQRQFLSLLVTNSFLPTDQSGIVNNNDMLYSNVAEIMAGQLNNILQRLDIPLDLGLKYQPGEGGTDIFDVAVSTQLFNNRVTVNGNIGNRQDGVTTTSSDVAGDLDIGIKLDRAGAVQLSLFSHSADLYTNYLDNLQRNGVGIGYQKDFRSFRQLWKDIFTSRRKREARERERREDRGKVTINIEENDH